MQHQLGIAVGELVDLHGGSQLLGHLLGGHAHGAEQMAVVHLHGDAAGGDQIVIVGVGNDGIGRRHILDAVRLVDIEIVQREHLGGILAEDSILQIIILVGDIDTNLCTGQGIKHTLAHHTVVAADWSDRIAPPQQSRCGKKEWQFTKHIYTIFISINTFYFSFTLMASRPMKVSSPLTSRISNPKW